MLPHWTSRFEAAWAEIHPLLAGDEEQRRQFRDDLVRVIRQCNWSIAVNRALLGAGRPDDKKKLQRGTAHFRKGLELIGGVRGHRLEVLAELVHERFGDPDDELAEFRDPINEIREAYEQAFEWIELLDQACQESAPHGPKPLRAEKTMIGRIAMCALRRGVLNSLGRGLTSPFVKICQVVLPLVGYTAGDNRYLVSTALAEAGLQGE